MNESFVPREAVNSAKTALASVTAVGLAVSTFLGICHLISISSLRRGEIYKPHNRWRIYLAVASFILILLLILLGMLAWVDWRGRDSRCYVIPNYVSLLFVVMRQFVALTMYSRAKIVHDGLKLKSYKLRLCRTLLFYTIVIGIWVTLGWSFWLNYFGKVVPEGMCIFYSRYPSVIIAFTVLDGLLGIALMLLFLVPLTAHTRAIAEVQDENKVTVKLQAVIRHNFFISMLLLVLDASGLIVLAVLLLIVNGRDVPPEVEHYQAWALTPAVSILLISTIVLHSMTFSWMPKRVRVMFKRSEFSVNDLNATSNDRVNVPKSPDVLFLGNLHGDGKHIETQIRVRSYAVPFDTVISRLFGVIVAKRAAASAISQLLLWRTVMTLYFVSLIVLCVLTLLGTVPEYVSYITMTGLIIALCFDNSLSLPMLKALFAKPEIAFRLAFSLVLCLLGCDIVRWGPRCATWIAIFFGMQYINLSDALVRESRTAFLVIMGTLGPLLAISVLTLLQFDLIADRRNTVITFEIVQPFQYSLYLLARDLAFFLSFLCCKDASKIFRGTGIKWFLHLDGDVAVRVVGLNAAREVTATTPQARGTNEGGTGSASSPKSLWFSQRRKQTSAVESNNAASNNSNPQLKLEANGGSSGQEIDIIELREQDSVVVHLVGLETGARVLQLYTEPWFRLVNEYLISVPVVLFIVGVLPGFLDPAFSFSFFLSLVPFARNFGLKSARLLTILTLRPSFMFELAVVVCGVSFVAVSFKDNYKDLLAMYLAIFWLDLRTNDARCVFFHTGTRKGRRFSPFERILFRIASFLMAISFLALPVVLFVGVTKDTDTLSGFTFISEEGSYPSKLDVVLYYQAGLDAIWLLVWKTIFDYYTDMSRRGRGVYLRYIRAPIAPKFTESEASDLPPQGSQSSRVEPLVYIENPLMSMTSPSVVALQSSIQSAEEPSSVN